MARYFCALVAILCAWITHGSVCAQESVDIPESEEVAVEVDLLDEGETDAALWTPEFLSAGAFAGWASQGHVYSSFDFAALSASDEAFNTGGDFVMTPRFQLGWESDSGWGVRGTYWEYENEFFDQQYAWNIESGQNVMSLDIDAYRRFEAGNSSVTIGGGLKSAHAQQQQFYPDREINSTVLPGVPPADVEPIPQRPTYGLFASAVLDEMSTEGWGPTLFAELRKPLLVHELGDLDFVINGRSSYIPANYEYRTASNRMYEIEDALWINEGAVGVELSRRLQRFVVRLRGQFETQAWSSSVMDDQAFTGVSTSLGIEW